MDDRSVDDLMSFINGANEGIFVCYISLFLSCSSQ